MDSAISFFEMLFFTERARVHATENIREDVLAPSAERRALCLSLAETYVDNKDPTIPDTSL